MVKEKTILKKWLTFFITDCKALEEYLEKMNQKGWKLKKLGTRTEFERCEPGKIIYSVKAFENENGFIQLDESEKNIVAEKGWIFVGAHNNICVFMTTNENVVDINVDIVNEYNTIKRKIYKQKIMPHLFYLPLFLVLIFTNSKNMDVDIISRMFVYIFIFMMVQISIQIFFYFFWKIRAYNFIKSKNKILYNGEKQVLLIKGVSIFFYIIFIFVTASIIKSVVISGRMGNIFMAMLFISLVVIFMILSNLNFKQYEY